MKGKAIILTLFILLLNVNPPVRGRAAAGTEGAWEPLNNPTVTGGEVELLARAPSNPDILYAGLATLLPYANSAAQILERSQDNGQTWQDIPQNNWSANALAVDAENPATLYATSYATGHSQLSRSLDGGATWRDATPPQNVNGKMGFFAFDPNFAWAAINTGGGISL